MDTTLKAPTHVAIIMDGNGRWATRRGMPRLFGHKAGAARVRAVVAACPDLGIRYLTIFAFSTENWRRSAVEVRGLMALFRRYISTETARLHANDVRVSFIGDRARLDGKLLRLMEGLEDKTRDNRGLRLTVAINYGGRDELARAQRRLLDAVAAGQIRPDEVTEATLGRFLDTHDLPDTDLVIRTSGERRISNFLLWQSAYAEYDFIDTLWPDFTPDELQGCLDRFMARERRFGAVAG